MLFMYLNGFHLSKVFFLFFKLKLTSCKAEKPLQGMKLQGKSGDKDEKFIGKPTRKSL